MVTRTRMRAVLTALGALHGSRRLIIGYFGLSCLHRRTRPEGQAGPRAAADDLIQERDRLIAERDAWEHRVSLLRADNLDPDMLDERARAMLNYAASARRHLDR